MIQEIIKKEKKTRLRWYDITNPTPQDIEFLKKKFNFHAVILNELTRPSARSKVETYDGYLFLVYHLPVYNHVEQVSEKAEIDFIATKDALITVHYDKIEPISRFEKVLKNNTHLRERIFEGTTGHLMYYILEETIEFSLRQLKHIEDKTNEIARDLFSGHERELLEKTSYLKRDLLDFFIITQPQQNILESLMAAGELFWGETLKIYFSDLLGDFMKIGHLTDMLKGTVESFEATNAQLLNAKSNHIMQRFTVLAFLTFPLMLLVALFDIDAVSRPIVGKPNDFWIIFGVMSTLIIAMVFFFKKKGWL